MCGGGEEGRFDTKNQLADMLTNEIFSRDEWNHLLRLFTIIGFSMFSCSHFSPIDNAKIMLKRVMQEEEFGEEGRVGANSKTKDEFSVEDC